MRIIGFVSDLVYSAKDSRGNSRIGRFLKAEKMRDQTEVGIFVEDYKSSSSDVPYSAGIYNGRVSLTSLDLARSVLIKEYCINNHVPPSGVHPDGEQIREKLRAQLERDRSDLIRRVEAEGVGCVEMRREFGSYGEIVRADREEEEN